MNYMYLLLVLTQVNKGYMSDILGMTLFSMFTVGVLMFSYVDYRKNKHDYALFFLILGYVNIIGFGVAFILTYFIG